MGLLGAGTALPFMGGDDEEEIIEEGWENTPASIANIHQHGKESRSKFIFSASECLHSIRIL